MIHYCSMEAMAGATSRAGMLTISGTPDFTSYVFIHKWSVLGFLLWQMILVLFAWMYGILYDKLL